MNAFTLLISLLFLTAAISFGHGSMADPMSRVYEVFFSTSDLDFGGVDYGSASG